MMALTTAVLAVYLFLDLIWVMEPQTTDYNDYLLGTVLLVIDFVRVPIHMVIESGWKDWEGFSFARIISN